MQAREGGRSRAGSKSGLLQLPTAAPAAAVAIAPHSVCGCPSQLDSEAPSLPNLSS